MKKIINWLKGQVSLQVTGWGSDRLLNICKRNNIVLYDFNTLDEGYSFTITSHDYKKILEYNDKIKATLKINNKIGLPYFFYRYKKRKIFILCFLLFVLAIFIFSNYIWNISIKGNELYTKEELIKEINNKYVPIGTRKSNIDCNILEKKLREDFSDIAWISCQIKGTNLIISLEETIPTDEVIEYTKPCNIIAYKDAIITDVITNKGKRIVNIGDTVEKNDIIITGVVNITNEYDEIIETSYVPSSGTVWGIVDYNYYDSFSMDSPIKTYTDETKSQFGVNIFSNNIMIPSNIKFENYDKISTNHNYSIFSNLYLPIGFIKTIYKEYTIVSNTYSPKEATELAKKRLITYIDNLKKKGVSILENNVTISIVDGKCTSSGTIKCKEVIGIPSDIEIIQEGED